MSVERSFADLLVQMETVSFGVVKSFKPNSTGGKEPPTVQMYGPDRNQWPLHLKWRAIWQGTSEGGKPDVLAAAREDYEAWVRRTAPLPRSVQTEDDWIILDGEGHSVEQVARKFRRSPHYIRKLRAEHGRTVELGTLDCEAGGVAPLPARSEREARVLELSARGLSTRQIVEEMGGKTVVQQTQVMRIIARARNRKAA